MALAPCPKCGSKSENCPLGHADLCPYDDAPSTEAVLREALHEIATADPVDMALDPNWPARIAKAALAKAK